MKCANGDFELGKVSGRNVRIRCKYENKCLHEVRKHRARPGDLENKGKRGKSEVDMRSSG
jgi:hypothetical protein